jgi:PAS domain S-box-containing protein
VRNICRSEANTPTRADLSCDASILYASDSIQVVLGYKPPEVLNRSAWEYFHPQELQFARSVHGRGVRLDKAAVLNYCSIRHKNGSWVGCECVFTVVYDVLIASTTVYGRGRGSQSKLLEKTSSKPPMQMLIFLISRACHRRPNCSPALRLLSQ